MTTTTADALPENAEDLHRYVHGRLCSMENLLEDQFETRQTPILKQGEHCGVQYMLRGPRAVRLAAVWASDRNELYLYDAQGRRAEKISLPHRIAV